MPAALSPLVRGLRRVYHGAPAPLRGEGVDPLAAMDPALRELKPRLATMVGLHAAADPRVADRVARERAAEDLRRDWRGWGSPRHDASWEDLLAFADRTGRPERFNPVVYPLRVEGNVRRIPQRYNGDVTLGRRLSGYEHDDYAVARDLIRNTMDRPAFTEWVGPRFNAEPREAAAAWDVLTQRRAPKHDDPWWLSREVAKFAGRPAEFVADADANLLLAPPATRERLVQRYRDQLRRRRVGALSYLNTGSNEEVPTGANPWSYIVLPGAERWLGRAAGGVVPGYAAGGKIPAAAAKWLRRAGPNEYRWLGNYPVPRSVTSNLYDPTAERYLWTADTPEAAIKDTRRRATDADPRVKDWYTKNLFERLARSAPDAPLHPDFANPETGEIWSWASNLNPQLLNMRHPLELTRKGDQGPDWLSTVMLKGDSEATLGALTRWALERYAKMGPAGELFANARRRELVSDRASQWSHDQRRSKDWRTDLTPERIEDFRETARRTAPVIKELRPQLNALAKKWYGGKRGMWGNALAAAYEHFNVPSPRGLYTGPLMQVSMQSYVNPFFYAEPSREPYPSLAEKLFERYPAVADVVGDSTLNQVLTSNTWNDTHPLAILSMQLENGQLRPEAFTKNRLPFFEGLARVGRYDAAAAREAAARRENTEAAQRAKAAELQRQVSKDVLALPADYDTGEFRFAQLPSHGRAPTPEDLDLTCRVGESMKYCLARRATAEQYLRESDHFLMHNAEGYPIALVEVKPTPYGPRVMQVQGYGNTVPRPEHRDVIADFLLKSVKPYDILSNALTGSGLRANPDWPAQLGHAPRWIKNTPDPDAE